MIKKLFRSCSLIVCTILILLVINSTWEKIGAASRSSYQINNLAPNYIVHWIGNTFAANKIVSNRNLRHVAQNVDDLYVAPDGTCYTNSVWDERFAQAAAYKNGDQTVIMERMLGKGKKGGHTVTADDKYVYVGATVQNIGFLEDNRFGNPVYPEIDRTWYGFRRYDAKTGSIAPFSQGYGIGSGFVAVNTDGNHLEGMVISDRLLYVSDTANNSLKAYELDNLSQQPAYSWNIESPSKLAFDRNGYLWIVQYLSNKIICFDLDQNQIVKTIDLADDSIAYDLAIDARNRLLVSDLGQEQNIKTWVDIDSEPRISDTIGLKGGLFAENAGEFAALKFYNPTGVGVDARGNVYIAQDAWSSVKGGGTVIESYQPNLSLNWRVYSTEFMSGLDIDRQNNYLYSKERRYVLDSTKAPGQSIVYDSTTLNPYKFPNDPRLHIHFTDVQLRTIGSQKMLFMSDNNGKSLAVYLIQEQNNDQTIIPYALFTIAKKSWLPTQPQNNEWLWIDRNFNGQFEEDEYEINPEKKKIVGGTSNWYIEPNGNIWVPSGSSIYKFLISNSEANDPSWSFQHVIKNDSPVPLTDIKRAIYEPQTDVMYLSGYTLDSKYDGDRKAIGIKLARFDNWSKAASLNWIIDPPWNRMSLDKRQKPIALNVAGDYVFVGVGSTGKSNSINKQSTVFVYNKDNADYVGSMYHDRQVGPIMLDKIQGLNAIKNEDNSYFVFLEDAAFARSIMLHWQPR